MIIKYSKINKCLVILISLLFSVFCFSQTKGTKPNIIVILADDLGYADVGFNRATNTDAFPADRGIIPTPNLDLLANSGIICKNAHVAHPFCGPSRAAIMTGMYPHRIGAQYNLPNDITSPLGIPTNETYFSQVIQKDGSGNKIYNTAAFGKWHLGFAEGAYQPLDRGFDNFFGFLGGGKDYTRREYDAIWYKYTTSSASYNDASLYNTPKGTITNEYSDPLQRNRAYVDRKEFGLDDYLTDVLTDQAINYIQGKKADANPFMIYLAYNAPHTPLQAPQSEIDNFKINNPNFENLVRNSAYITESTPVVKQTDPVEKAALIEKFVQARITYATMVTNLDTNVGKLVAELKKDMAVYNNTVIIFLSDNGGYTYSKGAVNFPLDALKGSVLEGGHKVPMFVSWPNKITTPKTYDFQISSLDLYPTIVNLAGASIPSGKIIDGKDIMDNLIAGTEVRPDGGALYIVRPQLGFENGAIMSYPWKIVKTGGNGKWKLYNIVTDPGESTDVRKTQAGAETIISKLLDQAEIWVKDFNEVKPAWYDNDGEDGPDGPSGHPHLAFWNDGTLPGYDRLFERSSLTLGVKEESKTGYKMYPNPTSNYINLNFDVPISTLEIEILNMTGKIVKRIKGTNENKPSIDVSGLQSGTYLVRVKADSKVTVEKVVKI